MSRRMHQKVGVGRLGDHRLRYQHIGHKLAIRLEDPGVGEGERLHLRTVAELQHLAGSQQTCANALGDCVGRRSPAQVRPRQAACQAGREGRAQALHIPRVPGVIAAFHLGRIEIQARVDALRAALVMDGCFQAEAHDQVTAVGERAQ